MTRREIRLKDPLVAVAFERYRHLEGYHAHEWDRFLVRSRGFHDAANVAAVLGWWLHCWHWVSADHDEVIIEDRGVGGVDDER